MPDPHTAATQAPSTEPAPIRIGAVSYLNTAPMISGLDAWRAVELLRAVPARLSGMVLDGEADIGLVSLADYARAEGRLALLSCGMIGCDGPTLTVRVFSAVPPAEISVLHADTESHTSAVLARIILHEMHACQPEVRHFDARERHGSGSESVDEAWPESVLLIGDKVVTDSPPAVRYPYQIDLGQAWHELTGLPFVYAAWMCQHERAGEDAIRSAASVLDRQRRRNRMRLDSLVSAEAERRGWPGDLARKYIGELLRFEVDDRARQAVGVFFERASKLGLLPAVEPFWADWSPGVQPGGVSPVEPSGDVG